MADRYWIGGSGSWSSTTKWSTTAGGSGGASVPTSADNAIFDASSDSGAGITVTLTGASTCLNLTMSAIDQNLTFTGAFTLSVVGNLSLSATKTIDVTGITALSMTGTTTRTITSSGGTLTGGITFDGSGGTFTLQDALTITGAATLTRGGLSLSSYTFTCSTFSSSNINGRSIVFGTGKFVITSSSTATVWNTATITNLTIDASGGGDTLVELTGGGATTKTISAGALPETVIAGGNVYPSSISFSLLNTAGTVAFTTNNTVRNLTIANNSFTLSNVAITIYGNLLIGGTSPTLTAGTATWTFAATSGTKTITTNGDTLDFPITFNGAGGTFELGSDLTIGTSTSRAVVHTNGIVDFKGYNITLYGTWGLSQGTFAVTRQLKNTGGGSNKLILTIPATVSTQVFNANDYTSFTTDGNVNIQITGTGLYYMGRTSQGTVTNNFNVQVSSTSGTVVFGDASFGCSFKNLTIDNNSVTVQTFTAVFLGNYTVAGTSPTITYSGATWIWAATSGIQTINLNGHASNTINTAITVNGAGGTLQLQHSLNVGTSTSRTVTLQSGTLDLNGYTLTIFGVFSNSTSTARTLAFGSTGKIILTTTSGSSLTICDTATETNLTVTGTNPLIQVTGSGVGPLNITGTSSLINLQLSPSATATFAVTQNVKDLIIDNSSNITLNNGTRSVYGNLTIAGTNPTLVAGALVTTFAATSGTKTITTNAKIIDFPLTFNGVGGTWQLQDALTHGAGATARTLTLTNGTLDLNEYTLTIFGGFSSTNTNTRTVDFGTTGKIVLAMAGATLTQIWNTQTGTNLTIIGNNLVEVVGSGTLSRAISASQADIASTTFNFSILTTAGIVTNFGRYNNLTYNCTNTTVSGSPSLFGNLTMVTTVTSSSGQTTMIGSNGTITSNGNIIPFTIIIDTVGGTITLNDDLTLLIADSGNGALTLTNGTLNLNNFTATLNRFSSTNTNTRSIAFGTSGKILVRGTSDVTNSAIYMDTMGGFSFSGTSNIEANITTAAVTQRIRMGITSGATESNVMNFTLTGTTGTQQLLGSFKNITLNTDAIFTTNTTALCYGNFNHVKVSLTASTGSVTFASTSGTKTITSNGQTILYPIIFDGVGGTWQLQDALSVGNAASVTVTLTNGTLDLNSYTMTIFGIFSSSNSNTRRIQTTGSGGKIVLSLNTAATVWSTPTVTNMTTDGNILVQLTGGGAVVKTISAGALSEANSISFQLSNTAGTVAFTASDTVKNLTIDNNAVTISNIAIIIYGNFTISGTSPTLTAGANVWTFAATSGTKTITTSGETLTFPITFNGVGGTWSLQDALTMNSSRVMTLTNGTFNLNNYTCTAAGGFTATGSGSKVLAHGTGDLVISLAGAAAFNGNDLGVTDGSAAPVTITNSGTALYDHATPFVSGASGSILFNGTSQFLNVPANNAFLFDAGNFTIEAWIRPTSLGALRGIANTWQLGGAWNWNVTSGRYLNFAFTNAASGISTVSFTGTTRQVTANSWNHVAVVRNGNTITLYVNGVADATTFNATGMTMYYYDGSAKPLKIGVGSDTTGYFPGQITNFRIVKGTAVYTANFTPSTSPVTAVSGTSILVQQNLISAGTLTSTGTGKINMTSATAKTFVGGDNSYNTLNQGGAGTLTISGTNTFRNITNSVQPATILFTAGTTNTFTNDFDLNGTSGNLITIGSDTPASNFTLSKSSGTVDVSFCSISDSIATGGAAWYAGTTSTNGGNNTGWLFTNFVVAATSAFLAFFFP